MTAQGQKGMVPSSKVLEKVRLESLSCIVPRMSHRVDDDATVNTTTVFPLKESYSKNIQFPHSQTFWENSAKDYRHELLNEIAEEEEEEEESNSDRVQTRPKTRIISDKMQSRARLYHDSNLQEEEVEVEYVNTSHDRLEENIFFRDKVETKVRKPDQWDDPDFLPHDAHFNAILNVQEDEDLVRNSEAHRSHGDLEKYGKESQLQTDHVFQEYLRLMAICEKHEEKENAIRKARMNLDIQHSQEKDYAFRRNVSFDRPQRQVESNLLVNNDAVSDSRHSYDPFSVSNLSSPTILDETDSGTKLSSTRSSKGWLGQSETRSRFAQQTLRRSVSFDRRWDSFEENRFVNQDVEPDGQNPPEPYFPTESSLLQKKMDLEHTTTQMQRGKPKFLGMHQNQVLANKRIFEADAEPAALPESFPSSTYPSKENPFSVSSTVGAMISTNEPFQKSLSTKCPSGPNEFMSKITVVDSQHSLDPIFVSSSSSPPVSTNRKNESSSPSKNFSKGNYNIFETIQMTEEDQLTPSPFDECYGRQIDSIFMTNETIPDSHNSSAPSVVSESSLRPLYQGRGAVKSAESKTSSKDRADLSTPREPLRRSFASIQGRQNPVARNSFRSNERSFSNTQPGIDPSLSTMSWRKKREFLTSSSMPLKDSVTVDDRRGNCHSSAYGSSIIELNSQAVTSELSYTPSANIRPITPSPKASSNRKQQFAISPERDVQCDKGKKQQFYEANPYIPAYSDSVIIGRPISPENSYQYSNREQGSIAGLSPVTCSASQFRNSIFPSTSMHRKDEWRDESVDREPIERSNETIKVQHLSSKREVDPPAPRNPTPSQTCMPLFNKKIRSVVDRYNMLKESTRQTPPQPADNRQF